MLKIYLDWNCINNIQTRHPRLYELIKEYGHLFIFPYSNAHIRDLLVSRNGINPYYDRDINTLTEICGKHLLQFENNITNPLFCFPQDYIDSVGNFIELIQKINWFPNHLYSQLKENIRNSFTPKVLKRIQGANPEDAFEIINEALKTIHASSSIEDLTLSGLNIVREYMNEESQFKSLCLALDACGFRTDAKNKLFTNVDTDASHIFYASKCDILVSSDKKMRDKAKAMFSKYDIVTKVLTPVQFENLIIAEFKKEYSVEHISEIIQEYGRPIEKEDGLHYRKMESPFLGFFNVCMSIDEHIVEKKALTPEKSALFVYCFNTPYLFYTELEHLFNLIKSLLPQDLKQSFQNEYVNEICSRDKNRAIKAKYAFIVSNLNVLFEFCGDPIAPVPCPMLKVRFL